MKAIRVDAFGGPEVLQLVDVPQPVPKAGEALVRIAAAGINFTDIGQRRGRPGLQPGYIPGSEASGTIEALGDGVTSVQVGQPVMYTLVPGAYAEYAAVPVERLIPVPEGLVAKGHLVEAAAIPLQGLTAHYLLHEYAAVGTGTTVLVHAAAGGVGLLLTQYATHLGAHVIGTTSSAQKAANVKAAGARDVILYTETNFVDEVKRITGGKGVDLILDAVGKTTFAGDLEAVRIRGTIVIYGGASGQPDPIVPNSLGPKSLKLGGGTLGNFIATRDELMRRANDLFVGLREGWLQLRIDRILPLAEAAEAHRLVESRATSGKVLLRP